MKIQIDAQFFCSVARPRVLLVICWGLFLIGCSPSISSQTAAPSTQQISTQVQQGQEIRIGLVGRPTNVNVWALFDEVGASYANYALRWEYWPRLYTLSIPEMIFTPMAATGQPSKVLPEGEFYIATVNLREGLTWSDGQPFTSEDAAFTINTALAFELGFDWKAFYDPSIVDRVESEGGSTLRYYFKKMPDVGAWQYGALQGPIVQERYWDQKIQDAKAKLPSKSLEQEIIEAEVGKSGLEKEVNELSLRIRNLQQIGGQDRQLDAALKRAQANLDAANNSLSKLEDQRRDEFNQARQVLYSLDDTGEPTLGNWLPLDDYGGAWMNAIDPNPSFVQPHFEKASFSIFDDEANAVAALRADDVDIILQPHGLSDQVVLQLEGEPNIRIMTSPSRSTRFLIINPYNPTLSNPALRKALACMLINELFNSNTFHGYSSNGFYIPDSYWRLSSQPEGCSSLTELDRLQYSIELLKQAGYTWTVEPTMAEAGVNLSVPGGTEIPRLTILAPESDPQNGKTADLVRESFLQLGIPTVTSLVDIRDVNYAVFSSGEYDLAIQSWNLSSYPSYLCNWFTGPDAFLVANEKLDAECASLAVETDLAAAQKTVQKIQEILNQDLPLIPLITELRFDAYRNITFPFDSIVEGLSGAFGVPYLALPAP